MGIILFSEIQRFGKWLKWPLMGLILWLFYQLGISIGEGDEYKNWNFWEPVIVPLVLMGLLFVVKLETRMDKKGIYVQFFPFHWKPKFYAWESIVHVEVRTYRPIREYGGWGLKYGWGGQGMSYTVWGSTGLQLHFSNGKKLLIGTQKGETLKEILTHLQKLN